MTTTTSFETKWKWLWLVAHRTGIPRDIRNLLKKIAKKCLFGDITEELKREFTLWYPDVLQKQRPHVSEILRRVERCHFRGKTLSYGWYLTLDQIMDAEPLWIWTW